MRADPSSASASACTRSPPLCCGTPDGSTTASRRSEPSSGDWSPRPCLLCRARRCPPELPRAAWPAPGLAFRSSPRHSPWTRMGLSSLRSPAFQARARPERGSRPPVVHTSGSTRSRPASAIRTCRAGSCSARTSTPWGTLCCHDEEMAAPPPACGRQRSLMRGSSTTRRVRSQRLAITWLSVMNGAVGPAG